MNNKRLELIRKFIKSEGCLSFSKDMRYENTLQLSLLSKDNKNSVDVYTTQYSGVITVNEHSFQITWDEHALKDEHPILNPFLKKVSFLSQGNKDKAIEECAKENFVFFDEWVGSIIKRNISKHEQTT